MLLSVFPRLSSLVAITPTEIQHTNGKSTHQQKVNTQDMTKMANKKDMKDISEIGA